ncbi:hypothetical protein B0A52_00935 [Exophiala mesophila]|uniref:FAD-binding PCMH-type domain-containing protein n=1 Tax=Exophiala mesophila TaxID=212818 RepID=A0A438NIL8_EXOME|nr:hypothetical protein B0A52_00935 [Exophiala mesophila]
MRFTSSLWLLVATTTCSVVAQDNFEPIDFNITEALELQGVNVSALPELAALEERSSTVGCTIACESLKLLYGSNVLRQGSSPYQTFTDSYWSVQQASVDPFCIFKPGSDADVSVAVLISRLTRCPFAVKSGGHAAFAGASSINGGITISLQRLKQITISSDKKTVAIGPGNVWHDVYGALQSSNIAVIGGRVADIGVGGLTLGGGISFFSNIYGFAADNVASFDVVTASGLKVTATPSSYKDLYWALRGGGNNFGIVTKFTLNAFSLPGHQIWGGSRVHTPDQFDAVISAFVNLGVNSPTDTSASQIVSFAYAQSVGMDLVAADLVYAKPIANAPIFNEFFALTPIVDNTHVRTLTDLTEQFSASNPNGLRQTYWTATYKLDKALVTSVKDIFFDELNAIRNANGIVPALTLQVITQGQLNAMSKNGGNPLGLPASAGPFLLVNLNMMWTDAADDSRILKANSNIVKRSDALAKQRNLYEDYLYMNYASQFQAVIPSYGSSNQQKLKQIATKYDPTGVYQNLQPGYFKLNGAPSSGP